MNRAARASQRWCGFDQFLKDYKARRVRCGECRKIVTTYPVYCIGGELVGYRIPRHKTKPKMSKRPKGDRGARRV